MVCHFGVLLLHIIKGGCNGIGAWIFNSVLNGAILFLFLNFYVKMHFRGRNIGGGNGGNRLSAAVEKAEKLEQIKGRDI